MKMFVDCGEKFSPLHEMLKMHKTEGNRGKVIIFAPKQVQIKAYNMTALEITARQFREKQGSFFEIADTGRRVIINRGDKQAYFLAPVEDDGFVVTPELLAKLDTIRQKTKEGKYTECKTIESLNNFLDSL
jgi:hypothetical protein